MEKLNVFFYYEFKYFQQKLSVGSKNHKNVTKNHKNLSSFEYSVGSTRQMGIKNLKFSRYLFLVSYVLLFNEMLAITQKIKYLTWILFCKKRRRINRSVLRWTLQCRSSSRLRTGTALCLPGIRYYFSIRWLCIAIPDPHRHEARWHENRQTGKIDDPHWSFLRPLHSSCPDRHSLPVLRAGVLWRLDADLEREHVPEAPLCHSLSSACTMGSKTRARFCRVHDQIFYDHGGWYNQ